MREGGVRKGGSEGGRREGVSQHEHIIQVTGYGTAGEGVRLVTR